MSPIVEVGKSQPSGAIFTIRKRLEYRIDVISAGNVRISYRNPQVAGAAGLKPIFTYTGNEDPHIKTGADLTTEKLRKLVEIAINQSFPKA